MVGKKLGPLGEASALGLECVTKLVECMFAEPAEGQEPDAEALRLKSNDEFLVYITTVIQALLTRVCEARKSRPVVGNRCPGDPSSIANKHFTFYLYYFLAAHVCRFAE